VLCLEEKGPIAAKPDRGPSWSNDAQRPHFCPNYARHGYRWAFGALAHRAGAVSLQPAATRDTPAWLQFLDSLEACVPDGEVYLMADALPLHWTLASMLWNWGHPRFPFVPLPKRAAWLNLIEGFWKILDQRALAGRDCTNTELVDQALHAGVVDWNHGPTPFLWGRSVPPKRRLKRQYICCI
jgi:DDE superfamily endonuclease